MEARSRVWVVPVRWTMSIKRYVTQERSDRTLLFSNAHFIRNLTMASTNKM